ncbi:helix-turn-helix domain-containing protein [Streptomyces sp. NPDC058107]|uniref:helix-turn-helix domain-containing protein n=1 Tax=Streptomyces sp. NPDC058107 TaxID=3346343 RepID=UPI0036E27D39
MLEADGPTPVRRHSIRIQCSEDRRPRRRLPLTRRSAARPGADDGSAADGGRRPGGGRGRLPSVGRRLHVVQSAVSSTVRVLERERGTPWFDHTVHRVALTPGLSVPQASSAARPSR